MKSGLKIIASPEELKNRHNENGPSFQSRYGLHWFYRGKEMSFDEWCIATGKSEKEKAILLLIHG